MAAVRDYSDVTVASCLRLVGVKSKDLQKIRDDFSYFEIHGGLRGGGAGYNFSPSPYRWIYSYFPLLKTPTQEITFTQRSLFGSGLADVNSICIYIFSTFLFLFFWLNIFTQLASPRCTFTGLFTNLSSHKCNPLENLPFQTCLNNPHLFFSSCFVSSDFSLFVIQEQAISKRRRIIREN